MQFESVLCESVEKNSWSESMVDEKYEQIMLRLLVLVENAVCTWKPQLFLV